MQRLCDSLCNGRRRPAAKHSQQFCRQPREEPPVGDLSCPGQVYDTQIFTRAAEINNTTIYNTKRSIRISSDGSFFVIRLRFERRTHSLEGCCSIQLSYRTIFFKSVAKVRQFIENSNNLPKFFIRKLR